MSKYKVSLLTLTAIILILPQLMGLGKCNTYVKQKYELVKLFEKPIADNYNDTSLYLLHSRSKNLENSCILYENKYFLLPDIISPGFMGIDKNGNYCILNAYENLKIFDKNGKFIFKQNYPDKYQGFYFSFDDSGNLYMFMKNDTENKHDTIVFKINASDNISVLLSKDEIHELNRNLVPPCNFEENIAKRKREEGKDGIYFRVIPSASKIKTIYTDTNGRFVSPEKLIFYKIDETFDYKTVVPDSQYVYEILDISALTGDKVIYLNVYKSDKDGNIFVSGVKSNETEQISVDNKDKDAIKVNNLIFFIWEFWKD